MNIDALEYNTTRIRVKVEWISAVNLIKERYPPARRGDRTAVHKEVCLGEMEPERMEMR